jgi:uncharacterized protein YceK
VIGDPIGNAMRPTRPMLLVAGWLALASGLSGCMTVTSQLSFATGVAADGMIDPTAVVYGGSRVWFGTLGAGEGPANGYMWDHEPVTQAVMVLFLVIDLPLCLVADTALLPVTLIEHAFADAPEGAAQPAAER